MLKDSSTAGSLACAEKALHHYDLFLTQAKVMPYFHISPSKIFAVTGRLGTVCRGKRSHMTAYSLFLGETAVRFKPGHRG